MAPPRPAIAEGPLERLLPIALAIVLGLAAVYVSASSHGRGPRAEQTVAQQLAILRGDDYAIDGHRFYLPTLQNRVLFPGALWLVGDALPGGPAAWYRPLRALTAVAAFYAFWRVAAVIASRDPRVLAAASFVLYFSMQFAFNHPAEHPTDFPDLLFMLLIAGACVRGRLAVVAALCAIAALNRESAVFGGVIWAICQGFARAGQIRWRAIATGAGLAAGSYAIVLGARLAFGGRRAIQLNGQMVTGPAALWRQIGFAIAEPTIFVWPLSLALMLSPWALWLLWNRGAIDRRAGVLSLSAAAIAAMTLVLGLVMELRVLIPSLALIALAAARAQDAAARGA